MKKLWIILGCGLFLSACVLPEKNDPFEKLPEEKTEILEGELFPFSVSIATSATHRLESEGKLQGYLASNIVRLDAFEGRKVSVEGIFRSEKMRPIFWVEKITVKSLPKKENKTLNRFKTKNFTFTYPIEWEYTLAPNGTAYFLDKNDTNRKVFFTFSVLDKPEVNKESTDIDVLIKNFSAIREKENVASGKIQDTALLFSNNSKKVYKFIYTNKNTDILDKILDSFVEGASNIEQTMSNELKAQAELETQRVELLNLEKQAELDKEALAQKTVKEEHSGFFEKLFEKTEKNKEEQTPEKRTDKKTTIKDDIPKKIEQEETNQVDLSSDYKNIVDKRAFTYNSPSLGFTLKSPYGYWFRNFGRGGEAITRMGFSDQAFSQKSQVKIWLEVIGDDSPLTTAIELINNDGQLIIEAPRNNNSIFRITGNPKFRDMMWSVINSIK